LFRRLADRKVWKTAPATRKPVAPARAKIHSAADAAHVIQFAG